MVIPELGADQAKNAAALQCKSCICANTTAKLVAIALGTLGFMAFIFSKEKIFPPALGYTVVGFSGALVIRSAYAIYSNPATRARNSLIMLCAITCVAVGALAAQGHISGTTLGWTILGSVTVVLAECVPDEDVMNQARASHSRGADCCFEFVRCCC